MSGESCIVVRFQISSWSLVKQNSMSASVLLVTRRYYMFSVHVTSLSQGSGPHKESLV